MSRTLTVASRGSELAQIQTRIVLSKLEKLEHDEESRPRFGTLFMSTAGDKNLSQAIHVMGGKSMWTKELEEALKRGQVDMVVHSLKDVPTSLPDGCVIGGILEREDPVDSLVVKKGEGWKSLEELPEGSVIGTSSVRRVAQLKRKYPHLKFLDVRGNLNTRIAKLDAEDGPYAALILARAGLVRLGCGERITADVGPPILYYAVSQGALAIEVRAEDEEAIELCKRVSDRESGLKCTAERACLRVLEGGCSVPVGVASELVDGVLLKLTGCVTSVDGTEHVEETLEERVGCMEDAERTGAALARKLIGKGATRILQKAR